MSLEIRLVENKGNSIPRKTDTRTCSVCKGDNKSEIYKVIKVQTLNMVNNINSTSDSPGDTKKKIKKYVENIYDSKKNTSAVHDVIIKIGKQLKLPKGWESCEHCKGSLVDPNFNKSVKVKRGLQLWYLKVDKGFIVFEESISDIFEHIDELKEWYYDKFSKWAPNIFENWN